ncbi:MAG: hypothetical protein CL904_05030 [Dehalococcoidia bacterium]|nr:hypothetical protein [Dehalococcoidia bacterium]MQG15932.1 hypothetical protein [SAR202 cluster bacterium]|tara:strand:+ start:75 stop:515 length:441 start_codon:yes stop_codon:yes gene_type:complete
MSITSPSENQELKPIVLKVTQARIDNYAKASGDFNPIHIDHEFAAKSHFGRTIAHGMLIAAMLSDLMSENFSDSWAKSGKLKVRFRAPVYAEEIVTAKGYIKKVDVDNENQVKITCDIQVAKTTLNTGETDEEVVITGQASLIGNL